MHGIGTPGQTFRLASAKTDFLAGQMQPGEVMLEIPGPGDWQIAGDGLSAIARVRDAAEVKAGLNAYAQQKATDLLGESKSYTSNSTTIKSDCTAATLANWMALQQWAIGSPLNSTKWVANDLTTAVLPAIDVNPIATSVGERAGTIYNVFGAVLDAIAAGSIASEAAIDAAPWP